MNSNPDLLNNIETWQKINNPLLDKIGEMSIITSQNVTVGKAEINEVMDMSPHYHPQEQITVVLEGKMYIEYNGQKKNIGAGECCIIPGNVEHKVSILKVPFKSFDIFSPIKDDFIKSANMMEDK